MSMTLATRIVFLSIVIQKDGTHFSHDESISFERFSCVGPIDFLASRRLGFGSFGHSSSHQNEIDSIFYLFLNYFLVNRSGRSSP
jgi:hypothetical protein